MASQERRPLVVAAELVPTARLGADYNFVGVQALLADVVLARAAAAAAAGGLEVVVGPVLTVLVTAVMAGVDQAARDPHW